jgi:hypothetical protein
MSSSEEEVTPTTMTCPSTDQHDGQGAGSRVMSLDSPVSEQPRSAFKKYSTKSIQVPSIQLDRLRLSTPEPNPERVDAFTAPEDTQFQQEDHSREGIQNPASQNNVQIIF